MRCTHTPCTHTPCSRPSLSPSLPAHLAASAETHVHLLLEYCGGGELYAVLNSRSNKRLGEGEARFYGAEVLLALQALHLQGFVYR